jgi:hypothetical protein
MKRQAHARKKQAQRPKVRVEPGPLPPYKGLPPADRARILALRGLGWSYRQIEEETGRDKNTVCRFLNTPEAVQYQQENAEKILANYQAQLRGLVPEAVASLRDLLEKRDRYSTVKLLLGTRSLTERTEQSIEFKGQEPEHSAEEFIYHSLHGHWPDEPCRCKEKKS